MKVNQILRTTKPVKIEFTGATLLSVPEYLATCKRIPDMNQKWWLRSKSFDNNVDIVNEEGDIANEYCGNCDIYIRPALKIADIDKTELNIGDKFVINDTEFIIISDDYAITVYDIGMDRFDYCRNDYDKSEIKEKLKTWYIALTKED